MGPPELRICGLLSQMEFYIHLSDESVMMLSGVADEAIIQIPDFCTGSPRYEMLKRYYEERLEGCYRFDEDDPDSICLRWASEHPHGPREFYEDEYMECPCLHDGDAEDARVGCGTCDARMG